MIRPKEINELAARHQVRDTQIEKEYVLTWLLYGIAQNSTLRNMLAFKGGTVLKKVYFEDYRFSEDLYFTLLDETVSNLTLQTEFEEVYTFAKEEANISMQFKESNIHEKSGSLNFYVNYLGPLGGNLSSKDLKIDITRGEKMEFDSLLRSVIPGYSDLPPAGFELKCYSLAEVLIEKMVALMGRLEPRDLYDFWYLTEMERLNPADYRMEFASKARHKGHKPEQFPNKILAKETALRKAWETKLAHQMHDLPKFEDVFRQARRWLRF
ncbi:MAG: nucleotidyl transferase AbiEii/AbiGii toxin family protein [Verrucomicrobia bacterium]|nr:nucleotidyl transferase AbiEii/AbiGii toxin family protein [Cytophagales bacterium]